MCGIIGIVNKRRAVSLELYEALLHLQHRGQDSAGILSSDGAQFYLKTGAGLAGEVFTKDHLAELKGSVGLAHLRYPTSGGYSLQEAQPLITHEPDDIALVHNGNLVNYSEFKSYLEALGCILETQSDSELILKYLAHYLKNNNNNKNNQNPEDYFENLCRAITDLFTLAKGAYSIIVLIKNKGLLAFRDPHGLRPLVMGTRESETPDHTPDCTIDYCFASEDVLFKNLGFQSAGEISPGELVFISLSPENLGINSGQIFRKILSQKDFKPCLFEYVYFARPDAIINQISVYKARVQMGENLARAWRKKYPDITPNLVIPVPNTSNTPAIAFAQELNIPYAEGLYKNSFVGRTFIMPNQDKRIKSVRIKFSPQKQALKNKKVLLLDDSIVRGTTSIEIIKLIKEAGAQEIYLVSACPPIKFPCYYGINIPTSKELIANQYPDERDLAKVLGVDLLLYQTQEDLTEAILRDQNMTQNINQNINQKTIKQLCMACLNGDYFCGQPHQQPNQQALQKNHQAINQEALEADGALA